jgi:hypothetical protein
VPRSIGVFLDYNNVLREAERAFGVPYDALRTGLSPCRLAHQVARAGYAAEEDAFLCLVEVHYGVEDPEAPSHRELVARWLDDGTEVIPRVRRKRGGEVGVDMACALSCAHAVLDDPPRCDVVVLFSSDMDLRPATEIIGRYSRPGSVKTASWHEPGHHELAMPRDSEHKACENIQMPRTVLDASLRETSQA